MKFSTLSVVSLSLLTVACASNPRVLSVKSEPADAEVCIKGRANSKFITNAKQCIGATPFEADKMEVVDIHGTKRKIDFREMEDNKEQFYLVVTRPGYAPQSLNVPSWEHAITLKPEQSMAPVAAAPIAVEKTNGSVKITSSPVGALVYVNDYLKGNTPYMIEGKQGEVLRIKLEQTGFTPVEKSITVDAGKSMEVNLSLEESHTAVRQTASISDSKK